MITKFAQSLTDLIGNSTITPAAIQENTDAILVNSGNITTNTTNISTNTGNITTNTGNITTNTTNIGTNTTNITANTNAIALASGQLVGNNDFATTGIGGVVNEAVNVADAVASTVSVTSPDATDLPTVITLANETKADVNQLVTDLNAAIAQVNAFLLANQNANQMVP